MSTTWSSTSSRVAVAGASCYLEPSPTAKAQRLGGLRSDDPAALARLIAELPAPPWDVCLPAQDPQCAWLAQHGFTPYAETARMVRAVEGIPTPSPIPGVRIEPYRNEWAEQFAAAEREALAGVPKFVEIGQPSGYEGAAGFDCFVVAIRADRIVGFLQGQIPEGWVNWMGVVPDERKRGIGRLLVDQMVRAVREARGTHIGAEVDAAGPGVGFWSALGARERARLSCLIHRGAS